MDRKVKGFTLVELLIAIVILLILSSFAFVWLRNLVLNQRLKATSDSLISAYGTARLYAMTGRQSRPWGVHISDNRYILFVDTNYNCQFDQGEQINCNEPDECEQIPGVELIPAGGCNTITFDKKGYPRNSACGLGMCSVVLQSEAGYTRTVYINRFGRIRYELPQ